MEGLRVYSVCMYNVKSINVVYSTSLHTKSKSKEECGYIQLIIEPKSVKCLYVCNVCISTACVCSVRSVGQSSWTVPVHSVTQRSSTLIDWVAADCM